MFDNEEIDELVQESSGKEGHKKDKIHMTVWQVDGSERTHTLWSIKYYARAGANIFSLSHKLFQSGALSSHVKWLSISTLITNN